jgi:hypothetical protein
MQDFRKLEAWQKSHSIALRTYAKTATFPRAELFGLTSQMRRAAVSIPANIAEGSIVASGRWPIHYEFHLALPENSNISLSSRQI